MSNTNRFQYETLRSFSSSSMTGTYQALGTALQFPAIIIKIVNNSDQIVTISTNGSNDHDICPANGDFVYDCTKYNDGKQNGAFPSGTRFYVKGTAKDRDWETI